MKTGNTWWFGLARTRLEMGGPSDDLGNHTQGKHEDDETSARSVRERTHVWAFEASSQKTVTVSNPDSECKEQLLIDANTLKRLNI